MTTVLKSGEQITLWINTRHTLTEIDEEHLLLHTAELLRICGGLKHLLLNHILKSQNAIELNKLMSLNHHFQSIEEEQSTDNNDDQYDNEMQLNLISLPTDILKYISWFVAIETVNKLKNLCTSFRVSLLSEIKKANIRFKIMKEPSNLSQFIKDESIKWHQYRLPYSTKYQFIFDEIETDFNIPKKNQCIIWIEGDNEYLTLDTNHVQHHVLYKEFVKYQQIPMDRKCVLIDYTSEKFKVFIPQQVKTTNEVNIGSWLQYYTLKYVDLLSSKSFEIDHVLLHSELNIHSLCLSKYIEAKLVDYHDINSNFEICIEKMEKEAMFTHEFAKYLLDILDENDNRKFIFCKEWGLIAKPSDTVKYLNYFEADSILYCCKPPVIESILMNRISVKYYCGELEQDATLSVMNVQRSSANTEYVRFIIIENEDDDILVFECIDINYLNGFDVELPNIMDVDVFGDEWELPIVCWTGLHLLGNKENGRMDEVSSWLCFEHDSRVQSGILAQQFRDLYQQTFSDYE